ncbi:MAG TPA: multiheme c-type cytochrome [Burkholderiales bacterium]|nr:multiheme c-type cytochrome [Burkholderiales bacterium]
MKKLVIAAVAVMIAVSFVSMAQAQTKQDTLKWAEKTFKYVGEKSCKTCHKVEYESWMTTKHANAWATLKPEDQKKPECAGCHMTGKTAADSMIVNVTCEACHGPGSEYKSMKNMKDPKLAAAAGLLPVTEATCVQCHNKNSPTFKGFDFAKALEAGVHKRTEKKAAQ